MRSMRTHLRGIVIAAAAILALASAALALTIPASFSPRMFNSQQTHYFRINVTFNSINGQACVLVSGACSVKIGALPYNAFVKSVTIYSVTAFNSLTSDKVSLGIGQAALSADILAQTTLNTNAVLTTALAGFGLAVTGAGAAQSGSNGGFDLWVTYAQVGTAATAGQAIVIVDYTAPNDGTCAPVPQGSTAGAC